MLKENADKCLFQPPKALGGAVSSDPKDNRYIYLPLLCHCLAKNSSQIHPVHVHICIKNLWVKIQCNWSHYICSETIGNWKETKIRKLQQRQDRLWWRGIRKYASCIGDCTIIAKGCISSDMTKQNLFFFWKYFLLGLCYASISVAGCSKGGSFYQIGKLARNNIFQKLLPKHCVDLSLPLHTPYQSKVSIHIIIFIENTCEHLSRMYPEHPLVIMVCYYSVHPWCVLCM